MIFPETDVDGVVADVDVDDVKGTLVAGAVDVLEDFRPSKVGLLAISVLLDFKTASFLPGDLAEIIDNYIIELVEVVARNIKFTLQYNLMKVIISILHSSILIYIIV